MSPSINKANNTQKLRAAALYRIESQHCRQLAESKTSAQASKKVMVVAVTEMGVTNAQAVSVNSASVVVRCWADSSSVVFTSI